MTLLEELIQCAFRCAARKGHDAMIIWRTAQELAFDLTKIHSDYETEIEAVNKNHDLVEAVIKNDSGVLAKSSSGDIDAAKRYADELVAHCDPITRIPALKLSYLLLDTLRKRDDVRRRRDQWLDENMRQVNTVAGYWQQRQAYHSRIN